MSRVHVENEGCMRRHAAKGWVCFASRYAFSKNNQPTMVPIPNQNVPFGKATQMSQNDINRLNRLYKC